MKKIKPSGKWLKVKDFEPEEDGVFFTRLPGEDRLGQILSHWDGKKWQPRCMTVAAAMEQKNESYEMHLPGAEWCGAA